MGELSSQRQFSTPLLFISVLVLLLTLGLTVLYSASFDRALRMGLDGTYFFDRQLIFAMIGVAAAVIAAVTSPVIIRKLVPLMVAVSVLAMLLTQFTSFGQTRLGATRWLQIGPLSFQPSELLKVSAIFYIALYVDRKQAHIREFWVAAVPVAAVLLGAGLIIMQNDFSTTVIFLFLCFSVLLVGGLKLSHLSYFALLSGIPGLLLMMTKSYRLRRVIGFIYKDIDPSGINYQIHASIEAISSGGLLGKGFGQGTAKLGSIPEVQSDFIFAAFAEEFGFFGITAVIFLFLVFSFLAFRGASGHAGNNTFLYVAGFGCAFLILWQVLINISVVSGIIPPTGIVLPFFSSGGTNLVINLTMAGFLLGVMMRSTHHHGSESSSDSETHHRTLIGYEL
jgi:cell division protein FtsW